MKSPTASPSHSWYFKPSSKILTLLYSTELHRVSQGKKWIHVPLWSSTDLRLLDDLSMKRRRWGYRWFQLPRTDLSQCGRSSAHLEKWKSLKNTGDAFSDLRLAHFHLINSTAWISTSKARHLNMWDQDIWSGRWDLFFLGGGSMGFYPQLRLCNLDRWIHPLLNWFTLLKRLFSRWRSGYGKLRVV